MARRPRIDQAGYYHIVNRGVNKMNIFRHPDDYEYFEALMCFHMKSHGITLHNYCLMSNHYHLLIEISQENLSKFMRQVNMNYAIYYNKKYKRTGHLWQERFKSWYVTDEAYLYTLMCYIEQNPLKAKMVKSLETYPYSSYHYFLEKEIPECLQNAWIVRNHGNDKESIIKMLNSKVDSSALQELKTASSLVEAPNIDKKPDMQKLTKLLAGITGTKERNKKIVKVYEQGYSQHMIAKVLQLNQATVQRIIKRTKQH
ncbi:transposase [Sulfurovum sp.]|uniref:transposase n=1 Tax=Sulfurovum sp. TaxID=1969726 RepID=UPI0025DB8DB6|nr:transposase [Sulfurovum sp.]